MPSKTHQFSPFPLLQLMTVFLKAQSNQTKLMCVLFIPYDVKKVIQCLINFSFIVDFLYFIINHSNKYNHFDGVVTESQW